MKQVRIGNTDLTPSALCLGTGSFGTSIPQAEAFTLLDAFVAQGGNFLDTAHVYGNWVPDLPRSISERTLGAWMKARGNRQQILIGTKGAHPDLATMHIPRLAPADIEQDLQESLEHLQTDYIDLYQVHSPDPSTPIEETLRALDDLVRSG
ncbi:MAG: aldo/keto reductase, partial [Caldilineaceae bacterium]|nr:aldo/keto reductase [Caldilineaceae bacterium]